jgi:cellulose synthase (UDP-forming)
MDKRSYLNLHYWLKKLLNVIFILACLLITGSHLPVKAQASEIVDLPELNEALDKGIQLKNVHAYKEVYFTKPRTWQVLGGTNLVVKFHHSAELIPARSHLSIYINGQLVKKESLDKSSVEVKTISIPVPLAGLGNYNTIRFEVEQHYTDICEDPLDHSLWTFIHPETHINFKYRIIQPKVDLAEYPFPLYDPYAYGITTINFITPDISSNSNISINAMGIIAADIAQQISWRKLKFIASPASKPVNKDFNTVLAGTPSEIPSLKGYLGNNLRNINGTPTIVDSNGSALEDSQGIIKFIRNPENANRAILIVSANTPAGVNTAAKYLAHETLAKALKGNTYVVKSYSPQTTKPTTIAKYIHDKSLSFKQLGFKTERAERIGPIPLEYPIRVIPDLKTTDGMLNFNLVYSYSPDINPELSSIEVKFNDVSLEGVIIDNQQGVQNQTLKVRVPDQYVKPYNVLTVKFHIFPSKFGYCVDDYEDNIWGEISSESTVNLPGGAKIVFPDLGLLNDSFYPYSTQQDLSNAALIIPDNPTLEEYQSALNVTGAIAKQTYSDAGVDLIITTVSDYKNQSISDRNILLIGTPGSNPVIQDIKNKLKMTFDDNYKMFSPENTNFAVLAYDNNQGILQQIISSMNSNKVMTAVYGKTDTASKVSSTALSDKKNLIKLKTGSFYVVDGETVKNIELKEHKKEKTTVSSKKVGKVTSYWPPSGVWGWTATICGGIIIFIIVLFILNIIFAILFGRKGN